MRDVKKLSKQRERAADHAQMNRTSDRVCASLAEVRQSPKGRPKYSSLRKEIRQTLFGVTLVCTYVNGDHDVNESQRRKDDHKCTK
jgi:hypothetical protein